ncbi:hypothetical protein [Neobacillus vireti]|uniref:hypothetical protein n=1 Tax=Neobacillus vireti TaxID=220686 RepID=UPI003000E8A3
MRFSLEVFLDIEGSKTLNRGQFTAKSANDIPEVAYQFIKKIIRDVGYRTTIIEKVMVNGEDDMTEQIKEMDNKH